MNRLDSKFALNSSKLPEILELIKDSFFILEINGKRIQTYNTSYFDTDNYYMYTRHHCGAQNRYKVRHRYYKNDEMGFLEIKFKSNKGRTIKSRIQLNEINDVHSKKGIEYIEQKTPFKASDLKVALSNSFNRITLVSKKFDQRLTIDTNLHFYGFDKKFTNPNIAIIEVKIDKFSQDTGVHQVLKDLKIYQSGLSKYCLGMVYLNDNIRKNTFKPKLLTLKKIENA
ncbi:MAG: polyphosphate polymerase domain-containing protein [Methylococcales bacterium]